MLGEPGGGILLSKPLRPRLQCVALACIQVFCRGNSIGLWLQDALKKNNADELPDFYNIQLERPRDDPGGYDCLFIDAAARVCRSGRFLTNSVCFSSVFHVVASCWFSPGCKIEKVPPYFLSNPAMAVTEKHLINALPGHWGYHHTLTAVSSPAYTPVLYALQERH